MINTLDQQQQKPIRNGHKLWICFYTLLIAVLTYPSSIHAQGPATETLSAKIDGTILSWNEVTSNRWFRLQVIDNMPTIEIGPGIGADISSYIYQFSPQGDLIEAWLSSNVSGAAMEFHQWKTMGYHHWKRGKDELKDLTRVNFEIVGVDPTGSVTAMKLGGVPVELVARKFVSIDYGRRIHRYTQTQIGEIRLPGVTVRLTFNQGENTAKRRYYRAIAVTMNDDNCVDLGAIVELTDFRTKPEGVQLQWVDNNMQRQMQVRVDDNDAISITAIDLATGDSESETFELDQPNKNNLELLGLVTGLEYGSRTYQAQHNRGGPVGEKKVYKYVKSFALGDMVVERMMSPYENGLIFRPVATESAFVPR